MNDVERALSEIADIRRLALGSCFRSIDPGANAMCGLLVIAATIVQARWPAVPLEDAVHYVGVWGAVTVATAVIAAIEAVARGRRIHGPVANAMLREGLYRILPFVAVGAILGVEVCWLAPRSAWMLPGVWLLLIGLLGSAVLSGLPRGLAWIAGWYIACGIGVLGLAASRGELSPWMMGLPLGIGQIGVAWVLHGVEEERGD